MKKLTAHAQLAFCCSALLLAAGVRAQLEGSLFTSPEERTYLDYLRAEFLRNNAEDDFNIEQTDIPEIPDATTAEPDGPVEYSFGGAMSGRDGVRVWLNGQLLGESQLPEGFSVVQSGRSFSLRIVNDAKTYVLLPGQTVEMTGGTIIENFQRPLPVASAASSSITAPATDATPAEAAPTVDAADEEEVAPNSEQVGSTAANVPISTAFGEDEEIDDAVTQLSDAEAAQLAAALERRRSAAAKQEMPEATSPDAP